MAERTHFPEPRSGGRELPHGVDAPPRGARLACCAVVLLPAIVVPLAVCGCQIQGDREEPLRCNSDIQCPLGTSCDPWQRICVGAAHPEPARDAASGDRTAPEEPSCRLAGEGCDDGDPCTFGDVCTSDLLCAGTVYSCDDGFACTLDVCDGVGACRYTVLAGSCLIDGACVAQGKKRPTNPCQACLPSVSTLAWSNAGSGVCSDGDVCTDGDFCDGGECIGGAPRACDDGIACTKDACEPAGNVGCVFVPDDGLCNDSVQCTADACDAELGCRFVPKNEACYDANPCTVDTCDPDAGCLHAEDPAPCNDGIECTSDSCSLTKGCQNTPDDELCDDGDPDTLDTCVPEVGCSNEPG